MLGSNPKGGELRLSWLKPGEISVEDLTGADVQLAQETWV